jgi:hypothetical protein
MITLPNGSTVTKAFRGIAVDQAERFSQVVRNGLLTGETTPSYRKEAGRAAAIWRAGTHRKAASSSRW